VWLTLRDKVRIRAQRRALFDQTLSVVDAPAVSFAADGFPRLQGRYNGHAIIAGLIPDTLTIRRLPQLWLSVTLLEPLPQTCAFAILVRHAGTEFYALTLMFNERLEPPPGFPLETVIRGATQEAQKVLDALAKTFLAILADPRVKEIAVTPKGLRIVRQAAEGRRGEHLLLRQAAFESGSIPASDLAGVLSHLAALHCDIQNLQSAKAA
jgi:hypothetical protein